MLKTHKLYVNGAFVRAESGANDAVLGADGATVARVGVASRKDFRDAVAAARAAADAWAARSDYLRGQIVYRMAEMVEGRRAELAEAIVATATGRNARRAATKEVDAAIERLITFAGWADKYGQVIGCHDPVPGPYYTFTMPEPTGVVVALAPDEPSLLGLVTLIAPALAAGNTVVSISGLRHPLAASIMGEVCATSDLPAGVVNLLTGRRGPLIEHIAGHRDVNAVIAAGVSKSKAVALRQGTADNLKRVRILPHKGDDWYDDDRCADPGAFDGIVEFKTIWHPCA